MKNLNKIVLAAILSGGTVQAVTLFEADFETDTTANIGTITYNDGSNSQLAVTTAPDPTYDGFVLLADPTSGAGSPGATDITLTPTSAASLTGGQTALFSFDFAIRRTNGATKSHFITGYDSSNNAIFQFVLGEAGEFGNSGDADRQRPGYGISTGSENFVAGDIASGSNPAKFYFPGDGNHADGKSTTFASFDLSIGSAGWTVSANSSFNGAFTTNTLPTFDGSTFTDFAYVQITGESTAAGGYFDNMKIESVPEPSSAALLGLGGLALILRRRK